ncbi:hypothetical protein O6H91_10G092500 [Diphasiastrum complanatum]|uniref:Uncharacterized protein n=1 Tax=Diphasiastrum complanatum TaxID=34168 RepID=A0ACC2CJF9_DIPCM|nr:hypothetical protein O6H91_10G092500 [Diphasiastrum complanatum]
MQDFDLKRVFMSAFYHVDETHLVYNMLSLLWKGVQLEVNIGSGKFAAMIAVLLGLSHGLVVLLSKVLSADSPELLYTDCAVGFSAVLFALKVVLNYNSPRHTNIYGVLVPSRYAAWAELILIQIFVPGTSFVGHLCGILAGLLYIHVPRFFAGGRIYSTSLMRVAQWPWLILRGPFRFLSFYSRGLRERAFGHGRVGSSRDQAPRRDIGSPWLADTVWRCPACTYDNGAFVDICDMCGTARSSSVVQESNSSDSTETVASAPPWPPSDPSSSISTPSLEQLRQARLARFSGR